MAIDTIPFKAPVTVTVTNTSVEIVAENRNREYLCITNLSANQIFLAAGSAAVLNSGWPILSAGASLEMFKGQNLTRQAIYAIANTGTNTCAIQEA